MSERKKRKKSKGLITEPKKDSKKTLEEEIARAEARGKYAY